MTDAELRDAAEEAFKATTISYPEWRRRAAAGAYPDITKTKWWQGFSFLDQIGEPDSTWPPPEIAPPPWSPLRVLTVNSLQEWGTLYPTLRNGDRLLVNGVTFDRQLDLSPTIDGIAEIRFGAGVRMVGDPTPALNAAWLKPRGILRVFGGTLSNAKGHGLLAYESMGCGWWDFKVDGVGGSGVRVFGPNAPVDGLTLSGAVTNIGNDLSLDPHAEKGTGLHAAYIGGVGHSVRTGRFAIQAHDCKTGSIQVGQSDGCRFWIKAKNLTMNATQQTGGNAFQPFGLVRNAEVWMEAENVAKAVEPTWLASGSSVRVKYARATGVRKPPAYVSSPYVVYEDAQ